MDFYNYLYTTFGEKEPIFLSELSVPGMTEVNVRQQLKALTDSGIVKRFDKGIYFIPGNSMFKSGASLSPSKVIEKKYLTDNGNTSGYLTGSVFANQIGLTTQVPMTIELVTNKATKDYRETKLGKTSIIIRRPRTDVTDANCRILQLLDLLKDVDVISELSGEERNKRIKDYMDRLSISFSMLEPYLALYPDRLYRNLYEVGVLSGVSA